MIQPTLADTVTSVIDASSPPGDGSLIRLAQVKVDLPVEVSMGRDGSGRLTVHVHPFRWRWPTAFDQEPGRLSLRCRQEVRA